MAKGDKIMGHMAYMIVCDYQVDTVMNCRAERRHGLSQADRRCVQGIAAWAKGKGLLTIERHARNCLEWIDSPLSDEEVENDM